MSSIPTDYGPELHHLRVLDVLLREHGLTRAARELNVSQPALSKTLAHLRRHFDDPLFVRVGLRMEPTPKALQLQAPVRAILERMQSLRSEHVAFDPRISNRTFNFSVVDAGLIKLLPPLVERLLKEAPNVRLNVLQLEAAHLEPWLELGKLDFAMGSFPSLTKGIRRQPLWTERYVGVVRRGHPRIVVGSDACAPSRRKSTCWSRSRAAVTRTRRWSARSRPRSRRRTSSAASRCSSARRCWQSTPMRSRSCRRRSRPCWRHDLDLQIIRPPVKLPKIDIFQYWHDRLHRDAGNQWIRAVFASLFRKAAATLRRGRAAASAIQENMSESTTTAPETGSPAAAPASRPA